MPLSGRVYRLWLFRSTVKKAISTYLIDSKVIIASESIMLLVSISSLAYVELSVGQFFANLVNHKDLVTLTCCSLFLACHF